MEKAFVIGDIHGMIKELDAMLKHWKRGEERLIFVGDYVDRGDDSQATLYAVHELSRRSDVVCLRGNHEEMLLAYLLNPTEKTRHYYINGGNVTVSQLLKIPVEEVTPEKMVTLAQEVAQEYPWLIHWLKQRPYYTEFGDFIIVHAGVDLSLSDWKDTKPYDFVWLRDAFHEGENTTGRKIIFGHTPTRNLHDSSTMWVSDGKYGIDGGAVYHRLLIGVKISKKKLLDTIYIPTEGSAQ